MDHAVRRIAERQHGVFTRLQVASLGFSAAAIKWRLRTRLWHPLHPGVYRLDGVRPTWEQTALAVLLLAGPGGALSHRSAAFLYKLDGLADRPPSPVDLTLPRPQDLRAAGVVTHRSRRPVRSVGYAGLRVTPITQTLLDLAELLDEPALEIALDSAQRRFPRLGAWLARELGELGCGRHLRTLRRLLALRGGDRPTDSALEVKVRRLLRVANIPRPRIGYEATDSIGFIMRVDFAWPDHLVALHADGYRWHHQRARLDRDAVQRSRMSAAGWLSLSVTHHTLGDPAFLPTLVRVLRDRAPLLRLMAGAAPER